MILENSKSSASLKKEQAEEGWSAVCKREAVAEFDFKKLDVEGFEATDVEASEEVSEIWGIEEEGWSFKDVVGFGRDKSESNSFDVSRFPTKDLSSGLGILFNLALLCLDSFSNFLFSFFRLLTSSLNFLTLLFRFSHF